MNIFHTMEALDNQLLNQNKMKKSIRSKKCSQNTIIQILFNLSKIYNQMDNYNNNKVSNLSLEIIV
jgi:hypothetical protein